MYSTPLKYLLFVLLVLVSACSTTRAEILPSDFSFTMDVRTYAAGSPRNIHITIDAQGRGQFEVYDSRGVIRYDPSDVLIYDQDQVLSTGSFNLTPDEQERLWTAIHQNQFFDLTEDFRMAIGDSFAFIMIEADGNHHIVDNIGMEVPQVRALVEATDALLPEELDLEYGEGHVR